MERRVSSWIFRLPVAYFCNFPDSDRSPAGFETSPGPSTARDTPNGEESFPEPFERDSCASMVLAARSPPHSSAAKEGSQLKAPKPSPPSGDYSSPVKGMYRLLD